MADFKPLQYRIESIRHALDNMALIKEINEAEQKLKDIDSKIKRAKSYIEDLETDDEELPKPLRNCLKGLECDLQVCERIYEQESVKWKNERIKLALINNNASDINTDTKKSQLEEQEAICNDIKEKMKDINDTINYIHNEIGLEKQEEQKNNINIEKVEEIKQSDKVMKKKAKKKCILI